MHERIRQDNMSSSSSALDSKCSVNDVESVDSDEKNLRLTGEI